MLFGLYKLSVFWTIAIMDIIAGSRKMFNNLLVAGTNWDMPESGEGKYVYTLSLVTFKINVTDP